MILVSGTVGMMRTVAALLVPFIDHLIHNAVDALDHFRDVEGKCQGKVRPLHTVELKPNAQAAGLLKVSQHQI